MNKLCWPIRSVKLITLLLAQVLLVGCHTTITGDTRVVLNCPPYEDLYFVDAHSQVGKFYDTQTDNEMTADQIRAIIFQKMQSVNVARIILYPRAGQSHRNILDISNQTFGTTKIYPAIAVKGNYYSFLQKRVDSGKFRALGEVLLYHAEKSSISAPQVRRYPSDPRVQAIYKVAKEKEWPFIIHIEDAKMAADDTETQKMMYQELCRVGLKFAGYETHSMSEQLCRNLHQNELDMTDHPVVFIHMAQLAPDRVEWIINHNDNVYFMTSHSDQLSNESSDQPWIDMVITSNGNSRLSEPWVALIKKHPERFIFGLDNVTKSHWTDGYVGVVQRWKDALDQLPDSVAHAVAHGNAERLWGLTPLCNRVLPEDNDEETIQPDNFP